MSFGMMRRGMSGAASKFMTAPSAVRFAAAEAEAVMAGAGINATQEILGQIANDIVRGRYSDYELAYRSNLENGMTEADAGRNAAYSTLVQPTVNAAVTGGIFAGIMNVPNNVKAAYSFDGYGTYLFENGTDPIEEGLKLDPSSEAYKNAERLSKRYGKRGRVSADSYGLQGVLNDIERYNEWLYVQRMADIVGANFTTGPFNEDEAFANAKISGSDITVSDTADAPLTGLMRHETAHRVEALAPKEFSAYMSQLEGGGCH